MVSEAMKQVQVHQHLLDQGFSDLLSLDFSRVDLLGQGRAVVDQVSGNLDIPRIAPELAHSGLAGAVQATLGTERLCFHL
jgi:hypothetical protein